MVRKSIFFNQPIFHILYDTLYGHEAQPVFKSAAQNKLQVMPFSFLIKPLNRCHLMSQSTHGQSILAVISNVAFAIVMEQPTEKKTWMLSLSLQC